MHNFLDVTTTFIPNKNISVCRRHGKVTKVAKIPRKTKETKSEDVLEDDEAGEEWKSPEGGSLIAEDDDAGEEWKSPEGGSLTADDDPNGHQESLRMDLQENDEERDASNQQHVASLVSILVFLTFTLYCITHYNIQYNI